MGRKWGVYEKCWALRGGVWKILYLIRGSTKYWSEHLWQKYWPKWPLPCWYTCTAVNGSRPPLGWKSWPCPPPRWYKCKTPYPVLWSNINDCVIKLIEKLGGQFSQNFHQEIFLFHSIQILSKISLFSMGKSWKGFPTWHTHEAIWYMRPPIGVNNTSIIHKLWQKSFVSSWVTHGYHQVVF